MAHTHKLIDGVKIDLTADEITALEQYQFINASVTENLISNNAGTLRPTPYSDTRAKNVKG